MSTQPSTLKKRSVVAAAVALAVLLLFEFGVARTKWAYELTPGIFVASIYALEDNVVHPGPDPDVLVFGSSRLQDAVAPRLLESELGLDQGKAMNLAFPFGDVVATRLLYERNRDKLSTADVAVIGVEMWDLFGERRLDPTEEFFLPLDERLERSGKDRASLLMSSVWKTYALRKMSGYIFGGLLRGGPDQGPIGPDGRLQYAPTIGAGPDAIDAANQFDDRFSALEADDGLTGIGDRAELQRLIDVLAADGIEVILVHLPMRRDFLPEVERRLPTVIDDSRTILSSFDGTALTAMETNLDALGIPDTAYRDFGHTAEPGVEPITAYVAGLIRSVGAAAAS